MWDAAVKKLISVAIRSWAGLAGSLAWLVELIAVRFYKKAIRPAIVKAWAQAMAKLETNKEINEELKKYKEVINDPKSTADDVKNSAPDFLG